MNYYITGDTDRIFINTVLGCNSKCKYCYLKSIGINGIVDKATAKDIVMQLKEYPFFKAGKSGTILTIGCYSECWDKGNKQETKKLLRYLVEFDNYIQLATKQGFSLDEVKEINGICKFPNQIGIFFSIPTISHAFEIEPGTATTARRIESIEYCSLMDRTYPVLYIKPVIPNTTINDLKLYEELLSKLKIDCVVGPMLRSDEMGKSIVGSHHFSIVSNTEEEYIRQYLSKKASVFSHSTEIINKKRKKESL